MPAADGPDPYRIFLSRKNQIKHSTICTAVLQGVARPTWKSDTGTSLLIRYDTGMRTPKAPMTLCVMTKRVRPSPLKKPLKQNRKLVSMQSMA